MSAAMMGFALGVGFGVLLSVVATVFYRDWRDGHLGVERLPRERAR